MLTLVDRFRNATVAGFSDRALYSHCASLSRQRQRKATAGEVRKCEPGRSHITTPTGSIPNADTSVFWTRSAAVVLATFLANDNIRVFLCNNCVILHILC